MYTKEQLIPDKKYFIENGSQASYFEWLHSKGTNYSCYEQYMTGLSEQDVINNRIDLIRTIIYAIQKPVTFTYFYWTLIVLIIHKFNFKKPIMRLILYHFILRVLGDIFDKLGNLFNHYFTNEILYEGGAISKMRCKNDELSPLKWLVTRQFATVFWYTGEIIGDWYPLLRTHAIVKRSKAIFAVYITCLIFNLSKVALIVLHLSYSAGNMYNKDGALDNVKLSRFYAVYYVIQMTIIYTSFFYDLAVYLVLKRCVFQKNKKQYQQGFLKKFKSLSEYRVLVSALVSAIFLPIISVTFVIKFYYQKKDYWALDFSFEESRIMITSVSYFMIFIDQILLVTYKEEASSSNSNNNTNSNATYYYSSSNSAAKLLSGKSKYGLNSMGTLNSSENFKGSETFKSDNYNLFEQHSKNNIFNTNNMNNINHLNTMNNNDTDNEYDKNINTTSSYKNNNYYNNSFNNTSFNNNNTSFNNTSFNTNNKSKRKVSDINIITPDEDLSPTSSNHIFDYYDDSLYYVNYKNTNLINNNIKYTNNENNHQNMYNNSNNNSKYYFDSLKKHNNYK